MGFTNQSILAKLVASSVATWPVSDAKGSPLSGATWYPIELKPFFASVCAGSPYLERSLTRCQEQLPALLKLSPRAAIGDILARVSAMDKTNIDHVKQQLRHAKTEMALLLALLDLGGVLSDQEVMQHLSDFADACVEAALLAGLMALATDKRAKLDAAKINSSKHTPGISIIAMGKHGAGELNYSSDIDLVVIYDAAALPYLKDKTDQARWGPAQLAVKITQIMVAVLNDQTADGYVFRTDLRLRPDPGSSAIAVSLEMAENYYETYGQNWERAAFIKARACAGDKLLGQKLLKILEPFIWRKYLDFAAIEDIHSIKRQIHAVKGGVEMSFAGHDLKLGRGGIREIEFFVQTQQLILGGRNSLLRDQTTLGALAQLETAGHINKQTAKDLSLDYLYLRHLEHRLQMVQDEQTHKLPNDEPAMHRFMKFCGETDRQLFEQKILKTLARVHDHYADLFIDHDALSVDAGSLVFTGVDDDPNTIRALRSLGFADPSMVCAVIRGWHAGGMRVTASKRGKELLTRLVPALLSAIAKAEEPDRAFRLLDDFLRDMRSGVQVFSLFLKNPDLINILVDLGEVAPLLSQNMARRSRLVETLFLSGKGARDEVALTAYRDAESFEEGLDRIRREISDARFKQSIQVVLGKRYVRQSGLAFAQIADNAVNAILPLAQQEMRRLHGEIEGEIAVIGMGRLGARSLTATSDLDLVFVYDVDGGALSDGDRPLEGITWFTRLVRRLVTGLSAQTSEGGLYEIDMQLRPSGRAGPAAVSVQAFKDYYHNDAWTWELMALTKARVIAGDVRLASKLSTEIEALLSTKRAPVKLQKDVLDMRQKLLTGKPAKSIWDIKRLQGGLTDIDFICQYLALREGHQLGRFPENNWDIIPILQSAGLLSKAMSTRLLSAAKLYETILQFARASLGPVLRPEAMSLRQKVALSTYCGAPSMAALEQEIRQVSSAIAADYEAVVGPYDRPHDPPKSP